MAVPKKRKSHSKTRMGRSHHAVRITRFLACPQCGALNKPHRVCTSCGYYRQRLMTARFAATEQPEN